ncbi:hypothetical protein CCACVL1_19141 [Corchorus capsularis]|uniref:Uncharacterized protein n=1 Tax=Corchorus capsularis TaxID=210143 RepID=A0A1R3HIC8_COCAP|nr:hypothetical protein CCACVL1_19141 [Corchorus capsularis]
MVELARGIYQSQIELLEAIQEARPRTTNRGQSHDGSRRPTPPGGDDMLARNTTETQQQNEPSQRYATLSDLTTLLEREKAKLFRPSFFFMKDPPDPKYLVDKPYSPNYEASTFQLYDGRKGNAVEHVSKFLDAMGTHSMNPELFLREFSKSLTRRA